MSTDAQDWQRVVKTVGAAGAVTDAPDWQHIVVGPGGAPVGGGGAAGDYPPAWGYAAWTFPPGLATANNRESYTSQMFLFGAVACAKSAKAVNLCVVGTVATGLTPDKSFVVVYEPTYTAGMVTGVSLLGASAAGAMDAPMQVLGYHTIDLAAPVSLTPGNLYYIGWIMAFTGFPGFASMPNSMAGAPGVFPCPPTFFTSAHYTSPPASVSVTNANTAVGVEYWMALS